MRNTDKTKTKNNSIDEKAINKNPSSRNATPNRDANTSKQKLNELEGQKRMRPKMLNDIGKNQDFIGYVDLMTEDLNHKRQKMQACIDLFNLMHSNNMQLRCMQHNNILTLYCLTERRILCVNCTYGVTRHKTHKVLPLKDSNSYVSDDNILLKDIIDNDLRTLEQSIRNSQENSYILEKQMKRVLQKFEEDYERKFQQMKEKYAIDKERIKNGFDAIITKTRNLQKNIEQFKFKIWQTLSKIGIGKRNESNSNETEVVRQVFCVSLSELTRLQIRRLTKRQLQRLLTKLQQS